MGVGSAEGLGPRPGLKELGRVNPIIADRPGKRTTPVVHSAPNVRVQRIPPARDKPGTLERIDDDRLLDTREACPSSDKQRGFVTGPNLVGTTSPRESALIHLNSATAHGKLRYCRTPKQQPRTGFSQDAVPRKLSGSTIVGCSDKIFQNTIAAVDYLTRRPDDRITKHQRARIHCRRTGVGVGDIENGRSGSILG